jgi:hypothetical protein
MIDNIPMPPLVEDEDADAFYNSGKVAICGTRNSYDAITSFDSILKPFGLQVGLYDAGSSDHIFTIVPLTIATTLDPKLEAQQRLVDEAQKAAARSEERLRGMRLEVRTMLDDTKKTLDNTDVSDGMNRALLHAQIDVLSLLVKKIGY